MESNRKLKSLNSFQRQFMDELFFTRSNSHFLSSITPGGTLANGLAALKIHQTGYICRLTDALGEIYEGVWSVLGDIEFFKLSEAYILSNPSTSYNLSDYGRRFPEFLSSSNSVRTYPFITDLARLDLAFYDVFHLPQHGHIDPTELAIIEEFPYTIINFGMSVKLIKLTSRVLEIWKNRTQNVRVMPEFHGDQYLVLYKQNCNIFVKELEKQHFDLLSALNSGMSLGKYLDNNDYSQDDIAKLFYFIASARLITSVYRNSEV
jgi:hypothetical protein